MRTILASFATARRARLHREAAALYDALRQGYLDHLDLPDESRYLRLLARAYARELRRALRAA